MSIRKFLLVMMLLSGYVFCSTAVAATTPAMIDDVLTGTQLERREDYWWPSGSTGSSTYTEEVTPLEGVDDDNDEAPPPPGDDDYDDTPPTPQDDNPNDPPIEEPPIEQPTIEEPTVEQDQSTTIPSTSYDPLNNSKIVSTILSSNAVNYLAVRNLSDAVSDRLDELVSADDAVSDGGWAGAGGSKVSNSGSFKDESTYYEVGYDQLIAQTDNQRQYLGFSLTYVRGSIKYDGMRGSGKERDETLALYSLSKYRHGQYLSFVGTIGRYSNSYDLWDADNYNESAKNKTYGFSTGIGYGRKLYFDGGWYIDPHVNTTFAYIANNNYHISNGVDVTNAGVPSLIGRVGINVGKKFGRNNSGLVYLKGNWSHEFMSNYKTTMYYSDTNHKFTVTGNARESWFEYGTGVSYLLSDNNVLSISVGKSTGGSNYKDWVWNLGFKWAF